MNDKKKKTQKLTLIGKNSNLKQQQNSEHNDYEYFAIQNNNIVNNEVKKENTAKDTKEKEILELLMIVLHEEKEQNNEEKKEEKEKYLTLIHLFLEKHVSDLIFINNENVIKKLFVLFEKYFSRVSKFSIYDIEKGTIENLKIPIEDMCSIEETHSNFKVKETNWNELSYVYEIFVLLTNNFFNCVVLSKFLTKKFLYTFFSNINSNDSEERMLVKLLTYKLYCCNVELRKILLEVIEEYLLDLTISSKDIQISGLIDCFDILKSIYSGLNKPISKKFLNILERTILQTFKNKNLKLFWNNYKSFLISLIKEDNSVLLVITNFLYKSWPSRYPEKVCMLIDFVEIMINQYKTELLKLANFKRIASKIVTSIKDLNILVADKALIIFKNDVILKMMIDDFNWGNKIIVNIVQNIKNHWCEDIKGISLLVLSKFKNTYPNLFENVDLETKSYISTLKFSQATDELWEALRFELKAD